MAIEPLEWQVIAKRKQDEQRERIPKEWLLESLPGPEIKNYLDIPKTCKLLSKHELKITEEFDATGLAEAIRKRELKVVDVVRAFCKRAAIAHQLLACLTEILFSSALTRAAQLDSHLDAGKPPLGRLHGVPVSLKDTFKIKGYDASIGIAALAFKPADENSVLVDCLERAGAVLYCKTNIPQTLMALDSHNNLFGRTLNPYSMSVTAGGSSGGEGALLAMRGSVLGVGTDVGGSIRIPAMCNKLFGIKGSWQRVPYAGQENGTPVGASKVGIPASAGPLAHSVRDLELFYRAVSEQKPWELDPDVLPSPWRSLPTLPNNRKPTIGIVRRDAVMEPHPPILQLLDEIKAKLEGVGVEIVEVDITFLFSQCQSLANALFDLDGGNAMLDLIESFDEPLSPWLQTRLRRKSPISLNKLMELHARRTELQKQWLGIWKQGGKDMDAFICPVAPHPVPEIDRYNGVSYTSSFVLLDYPAGTLPVRLFGKDDTKGTIEGNLLGSWDQRNRELWDTTDRNVYIGTPLSVQVVTPKLQERRLVEVMQFIDDAVKQDANDTKFSAKL